MTLVARMKLESNMAALGIEPGSRGKELRTLTLKLLHCQAQCLLASYYEGLRLVPPLKFIYVTFKDNGPNYQNFGPKVVPRPPTPSPLQIS